MDTGDIALILNSSSMRKNKSFYYYEEIKQSFASSNLWNRCSISSKKVLLTSETRRPVKLGFILSKVWKVFLTTIEVVLALGAIAELILVIWGLMS